MKKYALRNKRKQLNTKYRWRGMAKSNYRKHNRKHRFDSESSKLLDRNEKM